MSFVIRCLDCGHAAPFIPVRCTAQNATASGARQNTIWLKWRRHFLPKSKTVRLICGATANCFPIHNPNPMLRLGEGGTPLHPGRELGMMLGLPNLFIKDERQGPTSSFKDRQAAVTIAALKEGGITEMVAASTGNVAICALRVCRPGGDQTLGFRHQPRSRRQDA